MATNDDDKPACQDGGSTETSGSASGGSSQNDDVNVDLAAKFSAFCDIKTKDHFTSKACNKLVKDCFEDHFKFKKVILTNRVDSSVFSKCKEKSKPHMIVNKGNCEKFLQFTAHEFAKLKTDNDKLGKDDPKVNEMYEKLKEKVMQSTGPKIKTVKPSATGNVQGLTDTTKYTGSHKLRFDETGKGRSKAGRSDEGKKSGYVASYKGEGTYEENKN
ncbi:tubulin polymerization-promoting protein family member 3-like [Mercenaria mercenaria]|uniref:tubulin polymerization-promoting protein family member 3-like n=1 Tax=Mercenaria mercenaria TaxID=6596 RepID=UPI00234F9C2C|nr:tubulin polymerization-promoting protein family member 3-like [Mercenaria mercenaria]XP_045212481.2 tubulin polymerization-promoting protein family member 3-like [Mercenaria mercenaria]XP_053389989.1 tubulin polymerization-promoting protein family member 3-like [Mercenaria mercenaria]XP_053390006.1 tubulin polymerization-promoting protein family member 3-like [Mercenaria mercenaria]